MGNQEEKEKEKAEKLAVKAQEEATAATKAAEEAAEKETAAKLAALNATGKKDEPPVVIPFDEKVIIKQPTEYVEFKNGEQSIVKVGEKKKEKK